MNEEIPQGGIQAPDIVYWASLGQQQTVENALAAGGDPNAVDEGGYSALQAAAENNFIDIVKLLVSKGAEVNYESNGFTALKLAEMSGNTEIIDYLKQNGAN